MVRFDAYHIPSDSFIKDVHEGTFFNAQKMTFSDYLIDDYILLQHTGLRDRKGQSIREFDALIVDKLICFVIYKPEYAEFKLLFPLTKKIQMNGKKQIYTGRSVIAGNILKYQGSSDEDRIKHLEFLFDIKQNIINFAYLKSWK